LKIGRSVILEIVAKEIMESKENAFENATT
jgi:hypothetical protein